MSKFVEMLQARWQAGKFTCVGLDPRLAQIHESISGETGALRLYRFCMKIVEATAAYALCFKPNIAFWLRVPEGDRALRSLIEHVRSRYRHVPIVLDHKLGDIGSTNEAYADYALDEMGADAVTLNPYLGAGANAPFLDREDRGCVWLCKTSNPGAEEFQDRQVVVHGEELARVNDTPTGAVLEQFEDTDVHTLLLHQLVAHNVTHNWNRNGNCALVTGATFLSDMALVRKIVGEMPLLIPGIGKQTEGQPDVLGSTVEAGMSPEGVGMIISSSRGVIHKSTEADFADAAAVEVIRLNTEINAAREALLAAA